MRAKQVRCRIDRMSGEIETERVTLGGHALSQGPRGIAREADRRCFCRAAAEEPRLAAAALLVRARSMGEDRLGCRKDGGSVGPNAVERAGTGEALELAAIEQPRIDPRGKILE